MALRLKLQLVVVADGEQVCVDDLGELNKSQERPEQWGLTLAEARVLLLEVQRQILGHQIAAFLASRTPCPTCGRRRGVKDHKTIVFRTLFGKLELASPRLRRCPCQHDGQASVSPLVELLPEHAAPELLYLESTWASLVSYGLTVKALRDFLPVDAALNASSVRRGTLRVARRVEAELGPEPVFPLGGCPGECASLPAAPEPITVGLDGGYLRHWERKQTPFVAIVGEAVPPDGPAKRFGFVQSHDPKPRRHLADVLNSQGLRHNQELVSLSDGEESLRQLQRYLHPHSQHLLDWFHLTMQLTGLGQSCKGLARLDAERAAEEHAQGEQEQGQVFHLPQDRDDAREPGDGRDDQGQRRAEQQLGHERGARITDESPAQASRADQRAEHADPDQGVHAARCLQTCNADRRRSRVVGLDGVGGRVVAPVPYPSSRGRSRHRRPCRTMNRLPPSAARSATRRRSAPAAGRFGQEQRLDRLPEIVADRVRAGQRRACAARPADRKNSLSAPFLKSGHSSCTRRGGGVAWRCRFGSLPLRSTRRLGG
jgi:hypothetical protein